MGGGVGCMWHQPGADIVPVAPLAAPAPSVICVNICKPKVPLSPNVRAVCLAFPLRKPGVIYQNKTYQTGWCSGESAGLQRHIK